MFTKYFDIVPNGLLALKSNVSLGLFLSGSDRSKHYHEAELNPLLPTPLFKDHVIPEITKIFHVRDAHIRIVLLRHFSHYCRLFDTQTLRSSIVPQVVIGFAPRSEC